MFRADPPKQSFAMRISVIIPTINESESIRAAVEHAIGAGADEVVIADGGSTDDTIAIAKSLGCEIAKSNPARGTQLNAGAKLATGDVFLFLHADSRIAKDVCQQIRERQQPFVFGAFRQKIMADGWKFRLIERGNALRVRWRGLAYGDQGIFATRQAFESCNGFQDIPLMEDVALSDQLKKIGWPILLDGPIEVGTRRWLKGGAIRQTIKNWYLYTRYRLGSSPERLAEIYGRHDTCENQNPSSHETLVSETSIDQIEG